MEKVKSMGLIASLMLLILAVVMVYLSIKGLLTIPSANTYEDSGLHTFEPYQVLPIQVRNSSAYSRSRRVNPTKTVYMVYYRATDGSGYQWSDRAITRELGQETVKEGVTVTRRVLSVSGGRTYITVEPDQTTESYASGLRQKYVLALALSAAYILVYLLIWGVTLSWRRR